MLTQIQAAGGVCHADWHRCIPAPHTVGSCPSFADEQLPVHHDFKSDLGKKGQRREKGAMLSGLTDPESRKRFWDE
eukprot:3199919-Rhodomonas_salina.1